MISKEEVLKIAKLAKLSVEDDEIDKLTLDMSSIIEYADAIASAEDEIVEFEKINSIANAFNEDIVLEITISSFPFISTSKFLSFWLFTVCNTVLTSSYTPRTLLLMMDLWNS